MAARRCPGGGEGGRVVGVPHESQLAEVSAVLIALFSIRKWETSRRRRDVFFERNVDVKRPQRRRGEPCAMRGTAGVGRGSGALQGALLGGQEVEGAGSAPLPRSTAVYLLGPTQRPSFSAEAVGSVPVLNSTTDTTSAFVLYNCTFYFTAVRTDVG